jgi:transcriptional regulator with XRE-family HTH domain
MNIAQHLAATLKTLRQQRGWSLSRLAEETGVSKPCSGRLSAMNPARR